MKEPSRAAGGPGPGAEAQALAKVKLPENPTWDQVKAYVAGVLATAQGRNWYSPSDPQIGALCKVGPENVPILLDCMADEQFDPPMAGQGESYVIGAVKRLARDEHKKMILDMLPTHLMLVAVVTEKHWELDAKNILVVELHAQPDSLPLEWIEAVAALKDPATYADLKTCLVKGWNQASTYRLIRDLPGFDAAGAIKEAWEGLEDPNLKATIAPYAAEQGVLDALEFAFDTLETPDTWKYTGSNPRQLVLRHVDARGSNQELIDWFEKNKGKLVFDPKDRKYKVKEPAAP